MAKKLLTTPKGVAVYPHLSKPDTKFKAEGVYHIKLKLDGIEAASLAGAIDNAMKESLKAARIQVTESHGADKAKKVGLSDAPYSRDETDGSVTFSFKMNATGKSRKTGEQFTMKPVIFNAQGVPTEGMKIGGGSIVRVSYEIVPFYKTAKVGAGVTLRLQAVQVITLVEYGANAASYGFTNEEGETTDGETPTPAAAGAAPAAATAEEEDDF